MFSGEEAWGKALDLLLFFEEYINITKKRMDYISYLDSFYKFKDGSELKDNPRYQKYLQDLQEYLVSFIKKSHPLMPADATLKEIRAEFDSKWDSGEFQGWGVTENSKDDPKSANESIIS
jgi:splicing factor 3A subunit 3